MLLQDLPQPNPEESHTLSSDISLQELTDAVTQMASGKAPGMDGLPDESFIEGTFPDSCRRAVISLLSKKEDLSLLMNWRPSALLCTDYKILSKL